MLSYFIISACCCCCFEPVCVCCLAEFPCTLIYYMQQMGNMLSSMYIYIYIYIYADLLPNPPIYAWIFQVVSFPQVLKYIGSMDSVNCKACCKIVRNFRDNDCYNNYAYFYLISLIYTSNPQKYNIITTI